MAYFWKKSALTKRFLMALLVGFMLPSAQALSPLASQDVVPHGETPFLTPVNLLVSYMLPVGVGYNIQDWDVQAKSPVKWSTSGIIMDDMKAYYGFHRYGREGDWQVKLFGPHAGVQAVQLFHVPPQRISPELLRAEFQRRHITYKLTSCSPRGSFLNVNAPGRQLTHLYVDAMGFVLFPSPDMPDATELKANGIQLLPLNACH